MSWLSDNSHNNLSRDAAWKVIAGKRVYYHDKICYQPWNSMNWCVWFSLAFALHCWTLEQRVLLIIFDRGQTIANGIIMFSQTINVADRMTGLHIWCLTVWKHDVYIIQHIHMEDIDIWQKIFSSLWNMGKELAAPGESWVRLTKA